MATRGTMAASKRHGKKQRKRPADDPITPDVAKLRGELETYMAEQGLRASEPRRIIVDEFFQSRDHLSIDDLLERARRHDERISYATVYRTIKMLVAGGIAHEHRFGDGFTRYELADDDAHHDHLICTVCGEITEFEEPLIEELQSRIADRHGFELVDHKHELYGTCGSCLRSRAQRAKA